MYRSFYSGWVLKGKLLLFSMTLFGNGTNLINLLIEFLKIYFSNIQFFTLEEDLGHSDVWLTWL